jgi:hypothetical protein
LEKNKKQKIKKIKKNVEKYCSKTKTTGGNTVAIHGIVFKKNYEVKFSSSSI